MARRRLVESQFFATCEKFKRGERKLVYNSNNTATAVNAIFLAPHCDLLAFVERNLARRHAPISAGIISLTFLLPRETARITALTALITFSLVERLVTLSGLGIITLFINNAELSPGYRHNIITDCLYHAPFDTDKMNRVEIMLSAFSTKIYSARTSYYVKRDLVCQNICHG